MQVDDIISLNLSKTWERLSAYGMRALACWDNYLNSRMGTAWVSEENIENSCQGGSW